MRNIRFWGRNCLQCMGIIAVTSVILLIVYGIGKMEIKTGNYKEVLQIYPYYLLLAGMMLLMIITLSYFQQYFNVLLSMNVTRKEVICGIWLSELCMIGIVLGAAGLIWKLAPGDAADSGTMLLPLFTGGMLIEGALMLVFGVVSMRWGKWGVIITIGITAIFGAGCGAAVVLADGAFVTALKSLAGMGHHFYPVCIAGAACYLLAGIFMAVMMQKTEVRM